MITINCNTAIKSQQTATDHKTPTRLQINFKKTVVYNKPDPIEISSKDQLKIWNGKRGLVEWKSRPTKMEFLIFILLCCKNDCLPNFFDFLFNHFLGIKSKNERAKTSWWIIIITGNEYDSASRKSLHHFFLFHFACNEMKCVELNRVTTIVPIPIRIEVKPNGSHLLTLMTFAFE